MMKRKRVILLLGAALGVALIAAFFLPKLSRKNAVFSESGTRTTTEGATQTESENAQEEKPLLSRIDLDSITRIELDRANAGRLLLTRSEGFWQAKSSGAQNDTVDNSGWLKHDALDPDTIEDLLYTFGRLYAEMSVAEGMPDLQQFGLDPPHVIGKAYGEDGLLVTLKLGNQLSSGNMYYLTVDDNPIVYTVWANHGIHLSYSLDDLRNRNLQRINKQDLRLVRLIENGTVTLEIQIVTEPVAEKYPSRSPRYYLSAPYQSPIAIDTQTFHKVLGRYQPSMKIEQFVEDNPESLQSYGLDPPKGELTLQDDDTTFHLFFGREADDSRLHCRVPDKSIVEDEDRRRIEGTRTDRKPVSVFTIRKEDIWFFDVDPFDLVDTSIFIPYIEGVDAVRIRTPSLPRETVIEHKRDGGELRFTVNGKRIDASTYKQFYRSLVEMQFDAEVPENTPAVAAGEEVADRPEAEIIYELNSRTGTAGGNSTGSTFRIGFIPYNKDFYALDRNGAVDFVISRRKVEKIFDQLDVLTE